MTRVAAALSVLTVLLLGAAGVTDDPGVLLTLVGAALWALAPSTAAARRPCRARPWSSPAAGPATPRTAPTASTILNAAGRPRPRAPGRVIPAI